MRASPVSSSDYFYSETIEIPFVVWHHGEPRPEAARQFVDPIVVNVLVLPDVFNRVSQQARSQTAASFVSRATAIPDPTGRSFLLEPIAWTADFDHACRALRVDRNRASRTLHELKQAAGLGGADNVSIH